MGNQCCHVGCFRGLFPGLRPARQDLVFLGAPVVRALPGPSGQLNAVLRGRLHLPRDDDYNAARGVPGSDGVVKYPLDASEEDASFRPTWNQDSIGYPVAIACAVSVSEVQEVVKYALEFCIPRGVHLCVAAGRHSHQCMLDDAVVLDLSFMNKVKVDSVKRLAHAEGGALLGQLEAACAEHGLATTGGHCASLGVGGLILQGGHGYLERKFGLMSDNLVACEVVLASGELVVASATENSDLFWALQGGGGNFGVVVSFTLRLHEIPPLLHAGQRSHVPLGCCGLPGRAELIARFCALFEEGAPDEATGLLLLPSGGRVIERLMWVGDPKDGKAFFDERCLGHPVADDRSSQSYAAGIQRFEFLDTGFFYPAGVLLSSFPQAAVEAVASMVERRSSPNSLCQVWIMPLGGEASRRLPANSPYPHRSARVWILIFARWKPSGNLDKDKAQRAKVVQWVRNLKQSLIPWTCGTYGVGAPLASAAETDWATAPIEGGAVGCYMGFRNIYGDHLPKLQVLKAKYDPQNVFQLNDNIVPGSMPRPPSPEVPDEYDI